MSRRNSTAGAALWIAAGAALWLPLLVRWARAWAVAPDQAYGWGVPVLAGYLLAERWKRAGPADGVARRAGATRSIFAGLLLVALDLPILEANALWPTAQVIGALGAVLATGGGFALLGGWVWARRLIFPFLFLWTALTWPTPVKSWVVAHLSAFNALLAAEVVSAAGHPAVVNGNVIAVSTGLVGIEEACSGLRSLQAIWMVAWFAGEFFLLNWPRRLFLVGAGLLCAMAANLARTIALTWLAAADGLGVSERWHDTAGNVELVLGLAGVAVLAWRAHRGQGVRRPAVSGAGFPARGLVWPALAAIAVMAVAEAGTQAWYRAHETGAAPGLVHWRLAAPGGEWTPIAVPTREAQVLGSSDAAGLTSAPPRLPFAAWVFLVNWEGDAARSENPEWHDPAICLPAAGARLLAELGPAGVAVGDRSLPFTGYRFAAGGGDVIVYFCHWDAETARARVEGAGAAEDYRSRRWQRVWEGRRQGDVAHIAFVLATSDPDAALAFVRRWTPVLLRPAGG